MLKHTLKLIWNRKGSNALIIVELVLAFLVVFFVAGYGAYHAYLYQQPLGFQWRDTLELDIATGGEWTEEDGQILQQLMQVTEDMPEVEWVHVVNMPAFRGYRWTSPTVHQGLKERTFFNQLTDGAPEDLGIELLEGRWFNAADAATEDEEVVINERLRDALFADESPIGANIRNPPSDPEDEAAPPLRVIGVFRDFRQWGELHALTAYGITRFPLEDLAERANALQLRIRPGTPVDFEQSLQRTVESLAPGWRIGIRPLEDLREQRIREFLIPLTLVSLVSGFLLLMVAFGLFGVLWQSVTRRTDELGLRRAVGASRRRLYWQIVLETVVLTGLATGLGAAVAIQFPLTQAIEAVTWRSAAAGIAAAALLLVALASLCSLYPAWLAARRSPAEALHYE